MDDREELRRYLEARLAECRHRPDLCAHAIAAYERVLANLDDAGDLFLLAQADSLDRYANLGRLHEALGDERKAEASRLRFDAARRARSHADLFAQMTAANDAAAPLEAASNRMNGVVASLLELAPMLEAGTAKEKRDAAARLRSLYDEARALEPGFTFARLSTYAPYRSRVPWDDAGVAGVVQVLAAGLMDAVVAQIVGGFKTTLGMYEGTLGPDNAKLRAAKALFAELEQAAARADMMSFTMTCGDKLTKMGALLGELANEKPAGPSSTSPSSRNPAVARAAAGYHQAYQSLRGQDHLVETKKVYERVFAVEAESESPVQFQRRLAEEGLLVAMSRVHLLETAKSQRALAAQMSQPAMLRCHDEQVRVLSQARCAQEVELAATAAAELATAETAWDQAFLAAATRLIGALTSWMLVKDDDNRRAVEDAARVTAARLGVDLDGLLAVPRVADHFAKVIAPPSGQPPDALAAALRHALAVCLQGRPPVVPGAPAVLTLWGSAVPLHDVLDAFARAPRPAPRG